MKRRPLMLRDLLLLTIGALTILIVALIAQDIFAEWRKVTRAQSMKEATFLGDQLFDTAEMLSVERDIEFSMLLATDPDSLKDLRSRLAGSRNDVDKIFEATIGVLKTYDFEGFAGQMQILETQFANLRELRDRIDQAATMPNAVGNHDLSERWFADSTAAILQTQNLWMQFIKHFVDVDPEMVFHMRFKHVLGIIMEYTGRQRALIGRLLAENADPTPAEQAQLLQWQGAVESGWTIGNTLADQGRLFPAIAPYFNDAKSHYLNVYDMVKDIFYVPGARHSGSYPISVEFWLDLATEAADSLNALKAASLKETHTYVETLEVQAQRSILYHLLTLVFALLLCVYSFWIVIFRVIQPVNSMVEALVSATEGKPVTLAPPTFSRQDEIGKLAFVLHVFQQNADEIKRTSEALGEREKQLQQSQKMEAIGNLTGGMAHDFNNLLGVIIGNLDLLGDQLTGNADAKGLAQSALDAAMRGADLTRRLLAFARQQPLQSQRIEVNELVSGITKLLSRMLGENIEVSLKLGADIWPVIADPAQLEAAVTNLATNARDAMPRGGKLIIATHNGQLDADYAAQHSEVIAGDYVVIEVSDTGSGMPPEVVARIFEPFFTTKERGKGTGLGLAMVFGFVKQSGGHINVYSEVGAGTTFRLYLPRANANAVAAPRNAAGLSAKGGHETILIVEDNDGMRKVVSRQLTELGYRTIETSNASAALDMLTANGKANGTIDLLFTDIVMPGKIDGLELARIVTDRWPSLRIVLTSGFPESRLSDQKELIDGLRLLSKPYRKQDLARMLREALDGQAGKMQA